MWQDFEEYGPQISPGDSTQLQTQTEQNQTEL
jgi:hypothetical protein